MAFLPEIQKYGSMVAGATEAIDVENDIFSNVLTIAGKFLPGPGSVPNIGETVPDSSPPTEPIAATPVLKAGTPLSGLADNPVLLIGIAIALYFVFIK